MLLSTILFIIMITVFISYVTFIWSNYGIQNSISDSYYVLPEKWNWLFVAFSWLFAFPAMILGDSYLMLFAGAGIVFVGAAAAMHVKSINIIHNIGAVSGIFLACIAIIIQYHMWYMILILIILSLISLKLDKKNIIWWVELIIFTSISIVLGISLF